MLKKAEIIRLKQTDHVLSELRILSMLDHPFLACDSPSRSQVKLHGVQQDDRLLYMLLEYMSGGELYTYLKAEGKVGIEAARYLVVTQVASTRHR